MSLPTDDPDDPRLTAYALGELGAAEREAIEKLLAESAEARAEVERTQTLVRALTVEYARERERYLATRPDDDAPSNVIALPAVPRRPARFPAVPMLQAAAVLAIAASLVYLSVRRPHVPAVTVASSSPPVALPQAASPPMTEREVAAIAPPSATPATLDDASSPVLARTSEKEEADRPDAPVARAADAARPAAKDARAFAVPREDARAAPNDGVASCLVRIRTAAGVYYAGVVLSGDGLILSAVPSNDDGTPCTVLLADQRESTAVVHRIKPGGQWSRLRIAATGLTTARFANRAPADDAPLTFAQIDPQTGVTTLARGRAFSRTKAGSINATSPTFAFDADGELLAVDSRPTDAVAAARRTRTAGATSPAKLLVRPFGAEERASFEQKGTETGAQP